MPDRVYLDTLREKEAEELRKKDVRTKAEELAIKIGLTVAEVDAVLLDEESNGRE